MTPRRPTEPGPHLGIKMSSSGAVRPCALCDQPTYPLDGPELFLAETWDLVCWQCGNEHAPAMTHMLVGFWDDLCTMADEEDRQQKVTLSA